MDCLTNKHELPCQATCMIGVANDDDDTDDDGDGDDRNTDDDDGDSVAKRPPLDFQFFKSWQSKVFCRTRQNGLKAIVFLLFLSFLSFFYFSKTF